MDYVYDHFNYDTFNILFNYVNIIYYIYLFYNMLKNILYFIYIFYISMMNMILMMMILMMYY